MKKKQIKALFLAMGVLSCSALFCGCTDQRNADAAKTATQSVDKARELTDQNAENVNNINETDAALDEE